MNIVIISASHREESNSIKIAKYAQNLLLNECNIKYSSILDLAKTSPELWGMNHLKGKNINESNLWQPISDQLKKSDSFVFVVPEWGGMVPAALKNLLLYANHKEFGHKPALIVTVSSGLGGSYPIQELRISGYKNSRICYIPEHLIIRKVDNFLNQDPSSYHQTRNRMLACLQLLTLYSSAFTSIRLNNSFDFDKFPNGM